jgi:hypothetical protein
MAAAFFFAPLSSWLVAAFLFAPIGCWLAAAFEPPGCSLAGNFLTPLCCWLAEAFFEPHGTSATIGLPRSSGEISLRCRFGRRPSACSVQ